MVHFTQYRSRALYIHTIRVTSSLIPDYSIRKSGGKRICAPVPGLSQLITSFFAWQLPGIRHRPVFAWPYHLFRSFTNNRDFRVCTFSNQAVHSPSLKSFFYFQHTAEDIPVCFRPSFVISKNSRFVELPFSTFGMFFNIPEKEITDKCVLYTKY